MAVYMMEGFENANTSDGNSTTVETYLERRFPQGYFNASTNPCSYPGWHTGRAVSGGSDNNSVGNYIRYYFSTNPTEIYIGFAVRPASTVVMPVDDYWMVWWSDINTRHVLCRWQGRDMVFHRDYVHASTVLLTVPNVFKQGVWQHFEIYVKVDNSAGVITVKRNGVQVATATGLDTVHTGSADIDHIELGMMNSYNDSFDGVTLWDDLWISDTSLGCIKVEEVNPTSDGTVTDFTPQGAGSNYVEVDELVFDGDTTYNWSVIAAPGSGNTDQFGCPNLSDITGNIVAVQIDVEGQTTDSTDTPMYAIAYENVTKGQSAAVSFTIDATYEYFRGIFENNPDTTSTWALSEVNAMEIGYEVV